jgi:hypothetical protein
MLSFPKMDEKCCDANFFMFLINNAEKYLATYLF